MQDKIEPCSDDSVSKALGKLLRCPVNENSIVLQLWSPAFGEMVYHVEDSQSNEECLLRSNLNKEEVADFRPHLTSFDEVEDTFVDLFQKSATLQLTTGELAVSILDAAAFKPAGGSRKMTQRERELKLTLVRERCEVE